MAHSHNVQQLLNDKPGGVLVRTSVLIRQIQFGPGQITGERKRIVQPDFHPSRACQHHETQKVFPIPGIILGEGSMFLDELLQCVPPVTPLKHDKPNTWRREIRVRNGLTDGSVSES